MNDSTRPFFKWEHCFTGFLVIGLLFALSPVMCFPSTTFWVSPSGDDGSPGTKMKPFRTLERARDAVRAVQGNQVQQDAVVYLRDGAHRLGQTFVLDWRDSGQNGYDVVYRAAPGEHPVICGSIQVGNWSTLRPGLRDLQGLCRSTQVAPVIRQRAARNPCTKRALPRRIPSGLF